MVIASRKRKSTWKVKRFRKKAKKINGLAISPALRDNFKCSMVYHDAPYSLNPGAGSCAALVWTMNGLYDPDISGIGHQPAGFDQFSVMYNEYNVRKAYIKVHFANTDTSNHQVVGIAITTQSGAYTTPNRYVENGNCVTAVLAPTGGGESCKTLTYTVDISAFAGHNVDNDDSWSGNSTSNPTNEVFAQVFAYGLCASLTDPAYVYADVEIRYDTEWRQPILNNVS